MAASKQAKQLSNNNLIIIMVLITLLVLGITAFLVKMLVADISLNAKVIGFKGKADTQVKQDVTAAPSLVNSYNALGASASVLADALPNTVDFPALIVEMENIANDAGVTLKSVGPVTVGSGGGTVATSVSGSSSSKGAVAVPIPQIYPFTIQVNGSYTSLQKVFSDLESSARPMRVAGIQITGSGSSMSAQINVNTYYQAPGVLPFGTEAVR